jgi:hypothetical protein
MLKESFYYEFSDCAKLQLTLAFTSTGEADSTTPPTPSSDWYAYAAHLTKIKEAASNF